MNGHSEKADRKNVTLLPMESATSFIGRFAASQRAPSTIDYCLDRDLSYEQLRLGQSHAIFAVARWSSVDHERLQQQACTRLSTTLVRLLGHDMPAGMLDLTYTRICPACLREDVSDSSSSMAMHGRLPWMLLCVRTCPHHGLAIIRLPLPEQQKSLQDFVGHVVPMKLQIVSGDFDVAVDAEPLLERYLFARLSGAVTNFWLDSFPPHVVARFSEVLGTALHFGRAQKSQDLSDEDLRTAVPRGFSALRDGPQAINQAFHELRVRPGKPQDGPQARYGILHRWFSGGQGERAEYDRLRDLFREHIIDTWPLDPGTEVFGVKVVEARVYTVASAAQHWAIPARKLRKALAAQGLVAKAGSLEKDLVEAFPIAAALEVIETLENSISRPETMQRLGLTQNQLKILERAGVLPVFKPGLNLKPRHARAAVDEFLNKIETTVTGIVEDKNPDWSPVFSVARRAKISLPVLLRQIMEGHMTDVRAASDENGIARLRLRLVDVLALKHREPESDRLGRRAVSEALKAGEAVVNWLVAEGRLSCQKTFVPGTSLPKWSFDPDEVALFNETYATVSRLSAEWGMSRPAVHKLIAVNLITPEFQNASGKVKFYARSQVQSIPR